MDFFSTILDILFPKQCLGCQKAGAFLCSECGKRARADEAFHENCPVALDYRNPAVRSAMHMLKYKGRGSAAKDLAREASFRFKDLLSAIKESGGHNKSIIIPLPLHKTRQRERGYNQSRLIASALIKMPGIKNTEVRNDILKKTTATSTQVSRKNKTERSKNIKGCFEVFDLKNTENKNIIVLDDIITTGSTLQEAKRALEKAGLKNVLLFALAH